MPPVLLLFDIDGTLLRAPAARKACQAAFRELFGSDEVLVNFDFSGQTDRKAFRQLAERAGVREPDVDAIISLYLQHLEKELRLDPGWCLPGVHELLNAFAHNPDFRLALGTGNVERGARVKLTVHQLNHYFPTGGFGDDAEERADILAAGLRRAREFYNCDFRQIIVIGDTPSDIAAARELGAKVLAVATGRPSRATLEQAGPDALLPDFADLAASISAINGLVAASPQSFGRLRGIP